MDETVTADQAPALSMDKVALNSNYGAIGDVLDYEYIVTNTGNTTLTTPITVSDNLIPTVTCPALPAGGLVPTASLTCSGSYAVTQADLNAGSVTNIASASSGDLTSPTDDATVDADQLPALELVKSALDTSFAVPGDTVDYAYLVTNTGNVNLTGAVTVSDDRIASVSCPSLPAGGLVPGDDIVCSATYIVTQADVDAGFVTNVATASNGGVRSSPDQATVNGDQAPALKLIKESVDFTYASPCLLYTSPSPRDRTRSRMPSSA